MYSFILGQLLVFWLQCNSKNTRNYNVSLLFRNSIWLVVLTLVQTGRRLLVLSNSCPSDLQRRLKRARLLLLQSVYFSSSVDFCFTPSFPTLFHTKLFELVSTFERLVCTVFRPKLYQTGFDHCSKRSRLKLVPTKGCRLKLTLFQAI